MHAALAALSLIAAPAWLSSIWSWLLANPAKDLAIATFLISSIATKLSPYPKDAGVVSALQIVLDTLSLLSHSDAKGLGGTSLNIPLVRSTPPAGTPVLSLAQAVGVADLPAPKGSAQVATLGASALALMLCSSSFYACAAFKSDLAAGKTAISACKGVEQAALPGLLIMGVDILEGHSDAAWQADLEAKLGPSALCVTQHIEATLTAEASAASTATPSPTAMTSLTVAESNKTKMLHRAQTYNAVKATP